MAAQSESCKAFAENLRAIIETRGLSIMGVAKELKISRAGLYRILDGEEGITLDRAERIAGHFKKTLPEMLRKKSLRISA